MISNIQRLLIKRVNQIHFDCYNLRKLIFNRYFDNSGNIGVFCQDNNEFQEFTLIAKDLVEISDDSNQKYFKLKDSIIIPTKDEIPDGIYIYLYIRKPDSSSYGKFRGDIDFVTNQEEYMDIKKAVIKEKVNGAELYDRPGWDTIQLSDRSINSVAYLTTADFAEKIRFRF